VAEEGAWVGPTQRGLRWTKRGAHLLLHVRIHVLNGDLRDLFCQWYPGMQTRKEPVQQAA
jgi:hypothetical protein